MTRATVFLLVVAETVRRLKSNGPARHFDAGARVLSCEGERKYEGNGDLMDVEMGLAHRYVTSATMSSDADEPPPNGSNATLTGRTGVANPSRRPRANRSGT
jgi:hypothetical protein